MRKYIFIPLLLVTLMLPISIFSQLTLSKIEAEIEKDHPVEHLPAPVLQEILQSPENASEYLLFDTRKPEEFAVSRISGAIQIDPDMKAEEFMKAYGDTLAGKHVIFYCSVGKRSSIFLEKVKMNAYDAKVASLANLRGGIFRWYNDGYTVMNDSTETDDVHPFDRFWGQLVEKRDE